MKNWAYALTATTIVLMSLGCQGDYRSDAKKLAGVWSQGDYPAAATLAYTDAKEEAKHKKNRVVYFLESGRAAQAAGDYATSIECFDAAFVDTFPYMKESPEATVSEALVTTVTNATMSKYRGTPNDRIMLHANNATNFMAMGHMDTARVELNRAVLWTEDAEHRYGKAIELAAKRNTDKVDDASAEWDGERSNDWARSTSGVMNNNTHQIMSEHYAGLPAKAAYANYINPWALHLDAVFRLSCTTQTYSNDFVQARSSLRSILAMNPKLQSDLEQEITWATNETTPLPTTWVYFMNGMGPHLEQEKIAMPLPLSGGFTMPTLALPKMVFNDDHIEAIDVTSSNNEVTRTALLADTANISSWHFKERLPLIISHEAIRATTKAIATYAAMQMAQQSQNALASLIAIAAVAYQVGSAQADLRCWRTMPAEIQVARVSTPTDGILQLSAPNGRSLGIASVVPDQSNILIVSLPSSAAHAASIMPIQLTGPRKPYAPTFSLKPSPEEANSEEIPAEGTDATSDEDLLNRASIETETPNGP